jgi:CBS domain-containing protein
MMTTMKPLVSMCAGDLMSPELIVIPEQMSLQGAARILSRAQVSGAPVVDSDNRCIGVLSAVDFLHWAENGGKSMAKCECTDTAWKPWQMLDKPEHAATLVCDVMTRNPVTASRRTTIGKLARKMLDAHIHRILVVDGDDKPVGIVSSTDILAALARDEAAHESLN